MTVGIENGEVEDGFIKSSKCLFSAERSCKPRYDRSLVFIAGSGDPSLQKEIKIIEDVLRQRHYKPKFAVFEQKLGEEVFCGKICSNIKAARFCIAYLTAPIKKGVFEPSVNVYWEHGLMTGFGKKVIPVIKKNNGEIPFNIRNLDLQFYSDEKDLQSVIVNIISNLEKEGFSSLPGEFRTYINLLHRQNQKYKNSEEDFPNIEMSSFSLKCIKAEIDWNINGLGSFEIYSEYVKRRFLWKERILIFGKYLERVNEEEIDFWIHQIDSFIKLKKNKKEKIFTAIIGFFVRDVIDIDLEKLNNSSDSLIVLIDDEFQKYGLPKAKKFFSLTSEEN